MGPEKIQNTDIVAKNEDIISFFNKDNGFIFAYKKTEKLTSAVYLVTNLFSDNEPMKWTLRNKVSNLLSFILSYKDITDSATHDFIYKTKSYVTEISSLLEVCFVGGLISKMNFSILKEEFFNLVQALDDSANNRNHLHNVILDDFFGEQNSTNVKDPYSTKTGMSLRLKTQNSPQTENFIKDKNSQILDNKSIKSTGLGNVKKNSRQAIILDLLKKNKELTIKDISKFIKDCSEKTIQRELIAFMASGVLKRTGERRWSKYSLNSSQ